MLFEYYRRSLKRFALPFDTYAHWRKIAKTLVLGKLACQRLEWIIWHATHGQNALKTARYFGIAPKTFWKWLKRFDEQNLRSLEEHSRAPLRKRQRQITSAQEIRIIALKKAHIRYGKAKIAVLYKETHKEAISQWKVQKVIERYRLYYHPAKQSRINRKRSRSVKRKRITDLRAKPTHGFLLCFDTIVLYWMGRKRYIFTAIDKYAKVAFARMYTTKSSFNARDFLYRLHFLLDGKIENAGHDNGTEFQGRFREACQKLGIPQYHSRIHTPKDNPVNERFNRTLQEEFIQLGNMTADTTLFNRQLTEWLIEYNFRRPHQTLGYMPPVNFVYKYMKVLPMYPSSTRA